MKHYIEIRTGKKILSVVADGIGDKNKEKKLIETLEKTIKALRQEEEKKERYGNEILINVEKNK